LGILVVVSGLIALRKPDGGAFGASGGWSIRPPGAWAAMGGV